MCDGIQVRGANNLTRLAPRESKNQKGPNQITQDSIISVGGVSKKKNCPLFVLSLSLLERDRKLFCHYSHLLLCRRHTLNVKDVFFVVRSSAWVASTGVVTK